MSERLLIKDAYILSMDPAIGDLERANILVEGGAIVSIGSAIEAPDAQVIDGRDMVALPGIIDAHTCLWQTVLRGILPDLWAGTYFSEFLPMRRRISAEDNYIAGYVGACEMLSYGTTTVVDYCHNARSMEHAEASLRALKESGIRHIFTFSFISDLPDAFESVDARLAGARTIFEAHDSPGSLTRVAIGLNSWGAPELEQEIGFARELGAPSCIHINEHGSISELSSRGLLGPDIIAIHGNFISNEELDAMAAAAMPICFTPSADVQGLPVDVVRRASTRGVPVIFGCDIPSMVASDPIGQLRVMFNVQGFLDGLMERSFSSVLGRRPKARPGLPLLTPTRLFEIATIETARALGIDDQVGSLTPGKRADILLIRKGDFGDSVDPAISAHLLLQTSPREIDTVIVDGLIRVRDGKLASYDTDRSKAAIAAARQRILN